MLFKYLEALGHGGLRVREIQTFAIKIKNCYTKVRCKIHRGGGFKNCKNYVASCNVKNLTVTYTYSPPV
jgi:hypothetical protein